MLLRGLKGELRRLGKKLVMLLMLLRGGLRGEREKLGKLFNKLGIRLGKLVKKFSIKSKMLLTI